MLYVLVVRRKNIERDRKTADLKPRWQLLLTRAASGAEIELPPLAGEDKKIVFKIWYQAQQTLKETAAEELISVGRQLGFKKLAAELVENSSRLDDLLGAIGGLGILEAEEHEGKILEYFENENAILSLVAAGALLKINPEKHVPRIIKEMGCRDTWPEDRVAGMLAEINPQLIVDIFKKKLEDISPESSSRCIKILIRLAPAEAADVIEKLLKTNRGVEEVSVCLYGAAELGHPRLLDLAKEYLEHDEFYVRLQATRAVGKLGGDEEKETIIKSLRDGNWWVRLRAAQALADLPGIDREELKRLSREHPDKFSRQIMNQVLQEKKI